MRDVGVDVVLRGARLVVGGTLLAVDGATRVERAAHRELHEETGLRAGHLERLHLLAGPEFRYSSQGQTWDTIGLLFRAREISGALRLPPDEISEARYFCPDELGGLDVLGVFTRRALSFWQSSAG